MAPLDGSLDWHLHHIRDEIAADWGALASDALTAEQRKSVREHLSMNLAALRELKIRKKLNLYSERMNRR